MKWLITYNENLCVIVLTVINLYILVSFPVL